MELNPASSTMDLATAANSGFFSMQMNRSPPALRKASPNKTAE
ncbi:hypothetical protein VDGD_20531 [Verticillium dahliae]|nr:hypothetical protein VDGD_20531 [Verticillium dahliae]